MVQIKKRSFFERLTGSVRAGEDEEENFEKITIKENKKNDNNHWIEEENDEAELTVDVFQTPTDIVVKTMVAGVKNEDLEITIGRDTLTIKGKRVEEHSIDDENYFTKELYWGKFGRTILLPQEIEPEYAEAVEKHGLLTIRLQKIDKNKKNTIKIKSI
mgnify:FL=1